MRRRGWDVVDGQLIAINSGRPEPIDDAITENLERVTRLADELAATGDHIQRTELVAELRWYASTIREALRWIEQAALEDDVNACKCCRHASNDSFLDDPRTCEDCGHQNEPWALACHECGEELDDPAPTPRWILDDAKADDDYERSADR